MKVKRILALIICFAMVLSSFGTIALADGSTNVAKVGDIEYATIDEAISAWTNGTTLTLLTDVTLSDVITLNSTEHHILNLSTYTMTAASGKNAFVIKACGTGAAERSAITINADSVNPGGINAGSKSVVYYKYADGGISGEDRPIIKINGGVFTGSTSSWGTAGIYTIGTAARKCATVNISGGTFNCSINGSGKSKLIISGGKFNYSVSSQGDSTCSRLISGGTFKSFGFMTADDNNTKFWIGTSMGNSNVGVYVDNDGYIVVGGTPVIEAGDTFEASAGYSGASSYLKYSSAATNDLYYTSVKEAMADNNKSTGSVTVYAEKIDMTGENYKGEIVVPEGNELIITVEEGTTPTWTVSAESVNVKYTDSEGNEVLINNEGNFETKKGVVVNGAEVDVQLVDGTDNSYNITLSDGTTWSEGDSVEMTFPAVEGALDGDMAYVVHEHEDEKYIYVGKVEDGSITFTNDIGFSVFTVNAGGIQEAIKEAAPNGTVEIIDDIVVDKWIMFSETLTIGNGNIITLSIDGLTINGNNHTLTINSIESAGNGNRLFYDATNLNIKDLTIKCADGVAGGVGLTSGVIENVTFDGGVTAIYPGNGDLTINNCTFATNGTAIYYEDERDNLKVTNNTFNQPDGVNVILIRGNTVFTGNTINSGRTVNIVSGSPVVTGNNFNDVRFKVYNVAEATIEDNTINNLQFNDDSTVKSTFGENILSEDAQTVLDNAVFAFDGSNINNLEDLKTFRDSVNSGDDYKGKTVVLNADIDLANEEWTPIGYLGKTFKGTFDGNGHTIKNLYINKGLNNAAENNGVGFFGRCDDTAVIKNLIIENADVQGSLYVGAVVGYGYTGKGIENCTVKGKIYIDAWWYAGVIGGNGYISLIDNCHVIGGENTNSYIKGNDGSYIGGIWGFRGEGNNKITNCTVTNISVTGVDRVGGISGIGHYGNTVSDCEVDSVSIQATDSEATTVGLIVGACQGTADSPTVFNSNVVTDTTAKVGDVEIKGLYGTNINGSTAVTNYIATINGIPYETLNEAFSALKEGDTLEIAAGTFSEGTIKLPATLKNVTIKGADNKKTIFKDMTLMASDGNSFEYIGVTIDGIVFDNSRISVTGWRNGDAITKDWTITNCEFKNLNDTSNSAPVHFNLDADEAAENFTFTNNVINGATGGSKSGLYLQATGNVILENNVINNVSFRPYVIQITTNDGKNDNFVVKGNTFSGSAKGRAQGLGNDSAGKDSVTLVITENIFKGITDAQQICYWNFNAETTTATLEKNYYDIDIKANPEKIYYNSAARSVEDLINMGVYPIYTELNEDGTINKDSLYTEMLPAVFVASIGDAKFTALADAANAAKSGDTITMLEDATLTETVTLPAGIIFNGNGKTITGNIVAGGDLTFEGYTKVTTFNAGYNKPTITIGEGATLETTSGRMVIGHGATFNITGSVADAKTADATSIIPSLIAPGASFTGAGVNFNVTNAYIKFSDYCSSKNSNASNTFNIKVTNSIWEQANKIQFSEPTNGMDPTFNFTVKDSVLNSTSHLVFAVTKGEIVIDNSLVNNGAYKQLENRSNLTIKNGSVVYASVQTSQNAKNPGTTTVDNATYVTTGTFGGADVGTGTLILQNNAKVTTGTLAKVNVTVDGTSLLTATNVGDTTTVTVDGSALEVGNTVKVIDLSGKASIEDIVTVKGDGVVATYGEDGDITITKQEVVVETPYGTLTNAYTSETGYWGECGGNAKESFEFKFYNNDTYMGYTKLNNIGGIIDGDVYVSWNIMLDAESNTDEYWDMAWEIAPTIDMQANRVEQWVDGVKVAECAIEPNWSDSIFPVVAAVTDENGKILSYVNNHLDATLENAIANGGNVVLLKDISLTNMITVPANTSVTLDLNGKTITGTDTTSKNFSIIDNRGELTVTGNGKMTLTATIDSDWNRYSAVIANNPGGKLVIENGTIEHLGGTDMAYGIDNLTNGKGTYAETIVNGGTVKSTYRGIRQFLNGVEAQNILTINGGTVEGANKSVFFHDPSTKANTGKLTVSENATLNGDVYLFVTEGSTEWPVEVSIAASAVNGEVISANVPEGYEIVKENGCYGVVEKTDAVAKIGETEYASLQDAVDAAADGNVITVITDVEQTDGILIKDKKITLDLNGKTFKVTEGSSTSSRNILVNGNSLVIIKNGTLIAGGDINSGAYGTVRTEGTAQVTLQDLKLYNYRGNGLNVKAVTGTTVNILNTEIYSQYGGGIEAAGANITLDNVKVDQKGMWTAPYNSMAISVNGGGTVTVNSGTYSTEPLAAEDAYNQGTSHGSWAAGVLNSGGTLIINGGTFTNGNYGEDSFATAARGLILADTGANIQINGGVFNALKGIVDIQNNLGDASKNPTGIIAGGTFSADPTNSYVTIADGYIVSGENGKITDDKYTVGKLFDIKTVGIYNFPLTNGRYPVGLFGAVSDLNYKEFGFIVEYEDNEGNIKEIRFAETKTYTHIKTKPGMVTENGIIYPETIDENAEYFYGNKLDFAEKYADTPLRYRPYAKLLNGRYIYGKVRTINDITDQN